MTDNVLEFKSKKDTEEVCSCELEFSDDILTNDAAKISLEFFEITTDTLMKNGVSPENPNYNTMFASLMQSMSYNRKASFEEMMYFSED